MKCPKCNQVVSENDLSCSNCGKVLKLKCPQCSAIGKRNICAECNYTILSKCFKCGKLNPTTQSNCTKCGMNVVASIALKEATINEFAVLCLEILNFEAIKKVFQSKKHLKQFKDNLYNIIKSQAIDSKVRVQDVGNLLIIRFCKDQDFQASCLSAINFALNITQLMSEVNKKLFKLQKVYLKIKLSISKGDFNDLKTDYDEIRRVEVIYNTEQGNEAFRNIQILVDSFVFKSTKKNYSYQSLSSIFIKNQMITFYELLIDKIFKSSNEDGSNNNSMNIAEIEDFQVPEEENDNLPLISFAEKKCSFIKLKPNELFEAIKKIISSNASNYIINVKSNYHIGKLSNINVSKLNSEFKDIEICAFNCSKESKFYPFGMFRDLIMSYYGLNDFGLQDGQAIDKAIYENSYLRELIFMNQSRINNSEEVRYKFFEIISQFFNSINKKMLFIIEDFENIDRGSLDVFKYLVENDFLRNTRFLISSDSDFYLHRNIYQLIGNENFYELEVKLASNKEIITTYDKKLKEIEKSFFFRKIVEGMRGSRFYLDQALDYLVENEVLSKYGNAYDLSQNKMIVIPQGIEELVKKRLMLLMNNESLFNLYVSLVLLGNEIPVSIKNILSEDNISFDLSTLQKNNLIEIQNGKLIKIKNYNLYRESLFSVIESSKLKQIAMNLIQRAEKCFDSPNPVMARLFELAGLKKQAFALWNQLADISLSLGDYAAYINCCNRYINLIEDAIEETQDKSAEVIKLEIYEQISSLLYKYYPEKIFNYLEILIDHAEEAEDDKRVKNLSNIMAQSCLLSGNYKHALEYIGKVISRTPAGSFDPSNSEFNLSYYLANLVAIEIYFNLGRLEGCIDLGDQIFKTINSIDIKSILPQDFSPKRLKEVLKESQIIVSIARIIQLKSDTPEKIQQLMNLYPEDVTTFKILLGIYNLVTGNLSDFNQNIKSVQSKGGQHDHQTNVIYLIYKLLYSISNQKWEEAGNTAHFAKRFASELKMHQASMFLDLIIGYSYNKIGNPKKAKQIYYDVLKLSGEKGLMSITVLSWYMIAEFEFDNDNVKVALGILNKAISNIEKDSNISHLFTFSFKLLFARVFIAHGDLEKAAFCANHSLEIALKHNLSYKISICSGLLTEIYKNLINNNNENTAYYQEKLNQLISLSINLKNY